MFWVLIEDESAMSFYKDVCGADVDVAANLRKRDEKEGKKEKPREKCFKCDKNLKMEPRPVTSERWSGGTTDSQSNTDRQHKK